DRRCGSRVRIRASRDHAPHVAPVKLKFPHPEDGGFNHHRDYKPSLYKDYQSILNLLAALGSSLKNIASDLDRFPAVWNSNPG
ncbi:hypothetical protein, partial [Aetokthonos hydrillicola]|uniref:hypothetical protein n=1 Tax=Aetokthonos hydrillicola TaxID=1550245 RepID=UPI001ABA5157